jgi:hypothetical protein
MKTRHPEFLSSQVGNPCVETLSRFVKVYRTGSKFILLSHNYSCHMVQDVCGLGSLERCDYDIESRSRS